MGKDDDRAEKRRAVNRLSQQKSRAHKEQRIKNLEETNSILEREIRSLKDRLLGKRSSPSLSQISSFFSPNSSQSVGGSGSGSGRGNSVPGPSEHEPSSSRIGLGGAHPAPGSVAASHSFSASASVSGSAPTNSGTYPFPRVTSVDLEACRQAFMAVLASVCDPHLNTIHAVAQKFAASRTGNPNAPTLNPPRPVDRPLNAQLTLAQSHFHAHAHAHSHYYNHSSLGANAPSPTTVPPELSYAAIFNDIFQQLPAEDYIPARGTEGPLFVPTFEPSHPMFDLEMDANGVWSQVLLSVDMAKTDAEDLAGRLCEKIRCYGFGPVLLKRDVTEVCQAFPSLQLAVTVA